MKLKSGWHIKSKYCVMLNFLNSNIVLWLYKRIPQVLERHTNTYVRYNRIRFSIIGEWMGVWREGEESGERRKQIVL